MPDEIKTITIEGVELASTGWWEFSSGPRFFTTEHFEAAIAAQDDPSIRTPKIKIGHTDPRFDGEPLLGSVVNLRLSENGQTLIGDYVIAASLAPLVAKSPDDEGEAPYAKRSVEGWFDVTSATGAEYAFVLTAVALLGETNPAVEDLEDIVGIFTNDDTFVAAASRGDVETGQRVLLAGAMVDRIRMDIWSEVPADDMPWGEWSWVRRVEVDSGSKGFLIVEDDDTGELYKVPWTISGDDVTYGEATEVVEQYVAASNGVAGKSIRFPRESNKVRGNSVTVAADGTRTGQGAEVELKDLAKKLGLPEDSTQETVDAKLAELTKAESTPEETPPAEKPEGEEKSEETPEETPAPATEQSPEGVAASETVTLDKATWEQVKAQAAAGAEARKRQYEGDRDAFLSDAIKAGKFPPARREHYTNLYDKDPEGTKKFVEELEANTIPVEARGHSENLEGGGGGEPTAYPPEWLPEVAARKREAAKA